MNAGQLCLSSYYLRWMFVEHYIPCTRKMHSTCFALVVFTADRATVRWTLDYVTSTSAYLDDVICRDYVTVNANQAVVFPRDVVFHGILMVSVRDLHSISATNLVFVLSRMKLSHVVLRGGGSVGDPQAATKINRLIIRTVAAIFASNLVASSRWR